MRTYYEILGISPNATLNDIKIAFIDKAKVTHPNSHRGNTQYAEAFNEVAEAYLILSNPYRKKMYDESLAKNYNYSFSDIGGRPADKEILYKCVGVIITKVTSEAAAAKRKAFLLMLKGCGWLALGLGVTIYTYCDAIKYGTPYIVMYGAIIAGGIQAIRSFIAYAQVIKDIELYKEYDLIRFLAVIGDGSR